uniref:Protein kinase domain-containing protein n=1 Tax=Leersia perrieri TaxID=77586 RepID=A0A0D9W230_9ORYZ
MLTCTQILLLLCLLDAPHYTNAAAADYPAAPFSFSLDLSNTSAYRDLRFEGNATTVQGKFVDLTCSASGLNKAECQPGRMSYNRSAVPLWDRTTNELASFATNFTFKIINQSDASRGDGMAFFLASYPSSLPGNSAGRGLGLINSADYIAYGPDRFVAIEFDTFSNDWEVPRQAGDHIGIDISSVAHSIKTASINFSRKGVMEASISFDNTTMMLVASVKFIDDPTSAPVNISAKLPDPRTLLPPEVAVGFSAATGSAYELHQIFSWSFRSTLAAPEQKDLAYATSSAPMPSGSGAGELLRAGSGADELLRSGVATGVERRGEAAPDLSRSNRRRRHRPDKMKEVIVVGFSIGGPVTLVLLVWCIVSWWKWRCTISEFDKGTRGVRRFKYHHLAVATNHFSMENRIGTGAFGEVHKGFLQELTELDRAREVAVKRILKESREGNKDFFDEVQAISRAKQKNLVELLGWGMKHSWNIIDFICWRTQKRSDLFLVDELVNNGNLHMHLQEAVVLPWRIRYKIVKDIGSALIYLHHDRDPYILHRDIKPSNILLDKEFNAKLADFGLSRTADNGTIQSSMVVGTANYLDPECMKTGKFNRSSDVYSFGLVLLEISCKNDENSYAQVWQRYIHKTLMQAADSRLLGEFDARQMERVILLGLWCCQRNTAMRPSMQEAMDFLDHGTPLPQLTNKPEDTTQVKLDV